MVLARDLSVMTIGIWDVWISNSTIYFHIMSLTHDASIFKSFIVQEKKYIDYVVCMIVAKF